jgi:hypothetical protein
LRSRDLPRLADAMPTSGTRDGLDSTPPTVEAPVGPSGAASDERLVGLWLHGKSDATVEAYRSLDSRASVAMNPATKMIPLA